MCVIYNISLEEPWYLSLGNGNGAKSQWRENVGEGSGAMPASTWHVMLRAGRIWILLSPIKGSFLRILLTTAERKFLQRGRPLGNGKNWSCAIRGSKQDQTCAKSTHIPAIFLYVVGIMGGSYYGFWRIFSGGEEGSGFIIDM